MIRTHDTLALRVIEERDHDGKPLHGRTVWASFLVAKQMSDMVHPQVIDSVRARLVENVVTAARAQGAGDRDQVHLAVVDPDELTAAWKKHAPMDPPPVPADVHVFVAYWTPEQETP